MEPGFEELVLQKHLGDCASWGHIDQIPHFFVFGVRADLVIQMFDHGFD